LVTRQTEPHIILVGLPGAGKSTVGRAAAGRLDRAFLDLDQEIERREGMSISRIFAQKGEAYFRARERALTEELAGQSALLLAPGGGWIMDPRTVALLCPPARMFYLRVRPETALRRLGDAVEFRPLLRGDAPLESLQRLLVEREACYASAEAIIDTEVLSVQEVIDIVVELASGASKG
jgi:shikimate kinase